MGTATKNGAGTKGKIKQLETIIKHLWNKIGEMTQTVASVYTGSRVFADRIVIIEEVLRRKGIIDEVSFEEARAAVLAAREEFRRVATTVDEAEWETAVTDWNSNPNNMRLSLRDLKEAKENGMIPTPEVPLPPVVEEPLLGDDEPVEPETIEETLDSKD